MTCRLCGVPSHRAFDHTVLGRHQVGYFTCEGCGSLQTEPPYWLDEAYAIEGVHIDVGQAARVLQTWLRLCLMLERIGFDRSLLCIDYGSSAGLLARLMRDAGYDYRVHDRYDTGKYANYFRVDSMQGLRPGLVSAFEVFEHFPDPAHSLHEILSVEPALVVFTTVFWEDQGRDWGYLVPICGQHVFFYTRRGLAAFADRYGYDLTPCLDLWVLVRRNSAYATALPAAGAAPVDAAFAGRMVTEVGWGTATTERDHAYAMERFGRELAQRATPPPLSLFQRVKAAIAG